MKPDKGGPLLFILWICVARGKCRKLDGESEETPNNGDRQNGFGYQLMQVLLGLEIRKRMI